MAKYIMIQGTTSNAGKTTVCAGLCRVLAQDGYKVAPFKAQNMGLNSFYDQNNLEMGFGQALQAYAAYIEPKAIMNPLLLKPKGQRQIDLILNGQLETTLSGNDFHNQKKYYFQQALDSLKLLEKDYDVIVIEGAGSPAEINISKPDIANMGLALELQAPVILVGNIELGGVFASIYGTYALLEETEQTLVKGFIINKLYGYAELLESGIKILEEKMDKKSLGILPFLPLKLEDEDMPVFREDKQSLVKIGLIKSSMATNLNVFKHLEGYHNLSINLLNQFSNLENYDILIIPSTNLLSSEISWYKENVTIKQQHIITYGNGQEIYEKLNLENSVLHIKEQTLSNELNNIINFIASKLKIDHHQLEQNYSLAEQREQELDKLAQHLRDNIDMEQIYQLIEK